MQEFPHHYTVTAKASTASDVELEADRLAPLSSASPAEFGGPGDRWSPETLLVAAIGDCLILTFRAIARGSGLAWTSFECHVTGKLDRVERTTRFVAFDMRAHLRLPTGGDREHAKRILEKAERKCLISNSLTATVHLTPTIEVATERRDELTPA